MKCRCGRPATVYAMDPYPDGWASYYCLNCKPSGWIITDYINPQE